MLYALSFLLAVAILSSICFFLKLPTPKAANILTGLMVLSGAGLIVVYMLTPSVFGVVLSFIFFLGAVHFMVKTRAASH